MRQKGRWVMRQIITVATMKGGSGKSTLASCLAVHWHLSGRPSTIVDADPQRSIARLAARERALGGVTATSSIRKVLNFLSFRIFAFWGSTIR